MSQGYTGWDCVPLNALGEIVSGGTPSRSNPSYWNGWIPWVTPAEITSLEDKYLHSTSERISSEGLAASAAKVLPVGSVLVTTRATMGAAAIAAIPVATNQGFKSIIPNQDTNSVFAYYCISTARREMIRLASGTTFLEISKADFERIRIRRPQRAEQVRIVAVLDMVDEVIAQTGAVITKLRQVRAGLLHDLLTRGLDENGEVRDPIAHPELFKDSPMGRIPRAWDAAELGDLVPNARPIVYGILMPGKGFPGGVPVIKVKNIKGGSIDTTELLLTDPRIDEVYRRSRVQTGDLLFTIRGTVGRIALVPESLNGANITQDTARVSLNRANPRFVARWLETPVATKFIETHTVGVAVRGINLGDVRKIPIAVPPRDEQDRIADVLDTSDQQLLAEQSSLVKLIHLKSGLAADLLTGRVRVPGVIPRDDVGEHLQATLALEAAGVIG